MEISYTPPEAAAEIIGNRRADKKLQERVRAYLKDDETNIPLLDAISERPPAVRAEYLARPTRGDLDYMQYAQELGFDAWTATYSKDSFTATNPKKGNMARPRLALPKNQMVKLKKFVQDEGRPIGSLTSDDGYSGSLEMWWGALRSYVLKEAALIGCETKVYDMSSWYSAQAEARGWEATPRSSKAAYYYPSLMGFYAVSAALFCDFSEFEPFTYAEPAFIEAKDALGVSPVIVRWSPQESYEQRGDGSRLVQECEVDLTDQPGLTYDSLPAWLEERIAQ